MLERLRELRAQIDALRAEVAARPATRLEKDIRYVSAGIGIRAPRDTFGLRMSQEEIAREEKLVAEYNEIANKLRQQRDDAKQAKINAAEAAKVRAQACAVCFASHAGEC